jgi:3-hydroxyacyl-[acyl-carrier-protein] dehydratase
MILEGLAQAGGVLAFKSSGLTTEQMKQKVMYFMSIDGAKFRHPVKPGDKLEYRVDIIKFRKNLIVLDAKAYVGEQLVSEAELKAMLVDK